MVPDVSRSEDTSQDSVIDVDPIESGTPRRRCSSCGTTCGRDYTDWSQVALGVGGCTSGGGVLVGYLISHPYVVAGSVAVFALTLFFGCCRIGCLQPVKNIEGQLDDFRIRNQELQGENDRLQKNIRELGKIRDDLKAANEDANRSVKELRGMLQEKVGALQSVTEKLQQTEKKLKVLEGLFDQYRQETRKVAKEINRFNRSQEVFKKQVGAFSGEVKKLEVHKKELFKKIDDFDDADEFQEQQMGQLNLIREGLQGDISFFQAQFSALSEELKEFRSNTKKIDVEEDEYQESVEKMEELGKTLKEKAEELARELEGVSDDESGDTAPGEEMV